MVQGFFAFAHAVPRYAQAARYLGVKQGGIFALGGTGRGDILGGAERHTDIVKEIFRPVIHNMGINVERHLYVGMAGQVLDLLDIQAGGAQVGDIGVPELVRGAMEVEGADYGMVGDLFPQGPLHRHIVAFLPVPAVADTGGAVLHDLPQAAEGLAAAGAAL